MAVLMLMALYISVCLLFQGKNKSSKGELDTCLRIVYFNHIAVVIRNVFGFKGDKKRVNTSAHRRHILVSDV